MQLKEEGFFWLRDLMINGSIGRSTNTVQRCIVSIVFCALCTISQAISSYIAAPPSKSWQKVMDAINKSRYVTCIIFICQCFLQNCHRPVPCKIVCHQTTDKQIWQIRCPFYTSLWLRKLLSFRNTQHCQCCIAYILSSNKLWYNCQVVNQGEKYECH